MTSANRALGRHRTFDVPSPFPSPSRDSAQKNELARFAGKHVVAEREGDELVIYALHDEQGMPATMDKNLRVIRSLADLNRRNAAVHHRRA